MLAALLTPGANRHVQAAAHSVDTSSDAADANPGDGVCSAAAGQCSLRAAIMEANALAGADTINLPAGTYNLAIAGADEDIAATGDLDITDDLTINGAGPATTIVDGGGLDRVFDIRTNASISDLTIRNGRVVNQSGGGMRLETGNLTISNSMITGNTVTNGEGGGLNLRGWENAVTITNSTVSNNTAHVCGGISSDRPGTLDRSTVSGNSASESDGGGVCNYSEEGPLTIINSTISGNTAAGHGGGLANYADGLTIITNSTITGNSAQDSGGGIWNGSVASFLVKNSIVANNPTGGDCSFSEGSTGHNLSSDATCPFTGPGDLTSTDPKLGPLANNGGPTQTHALLAASPAIDAGDNNGCPATDQRDTARPQDGNSDSIAVCDIGAYEYQYVAPPRLWGDTDCNGDVGAVDALKILRYVAALSVAQEPSCPVVGSTASVDDADRMWGDVDCGGDVGAVDALKILRYVAGLSVGQGPGCPLIGSAITISP